MRGDGIPPNNLEGGWHPPNNQMSRGDAIAVASPQIKVVATKFTSTRQFTITRLPRTRFGVNART
jgi:hypothetical protein